MPPGGHDISPVRVTAPGSVVSIPGAWNLITPRHHQGRVPWYPRRRTRTHLPPEVRRRAETGRSVGRAWCRQSLLGSIKSAWPDREVVAMPDWLFGVLVIAAVLALFVGARWVLSRGRRGSVRMLGTVLDSGAQARRGPWSGGLSKETVAALTRHATTGPPSSLTDGSGRGFGVPSVSG